MLNLRVLWVCCLIGVAAAAAAGQCDAEGSCSTDKDSAGLLQSKVNLDVESGEDGEAAVMGDAEEDGRVEDEDEDEDTIADEAEAEVDQDEDDTETTDEDDEAATECDPCDTACVKSANIALFEKCDTDENDRLTASEVQKCLKFHEKPEDEPEDLSLSEVDSRSLTDAGAAEWILDFDEDKDGELTQDEFAKSAGGDTCQTSLLEAEQTSEEETTGSCELGKVFNDKCFKSSTRQKSCLAETGEVLSDDDQVIAREGGRLGKIGRVVRKVARCVWKTVTSWAKCVGSIKFPSFTDCFKKLKEEKIGKKWSNVFPSCSNADDCKKKLTDIDLGFNPHAIRGSALGGFNQVKTGAMKLFNQIAKDVYGEARKKMDGAINGKGGRLVTSMYNKAPEMLSTLSKAGKDVGVAMGQFITGSLRQIKDYRIVKKWCSRDYGNFGFWYFAPTDCGAFNHLKNAFRVGIRKTRDLSGWNQAVRSFGDQLAKVGSSLATCVAKRAILSIPTPFIDLKIANWCVPSPVRIIINGVLGTFQYIFDQVGAAAGGCKDTKQPVCKLTNAVRGAAIDLVENFKGAFLQESTAIIGEKLHGDVSRYSAQCNAEDFKIFVLVKFAVRFPPWNDKMSLGVKFSNGCKDKKYFWDILINLGGQLFIAGYADPTKFFPDEISGSIVVDIGFSVGSPGKDWNTGLPGTDVVQWLGGFTLSAKVGFGKKVTIGLSLGFKLLPSPDYPRGFTISPKFGTRDLLQIKDGQRKIDEATRDAEGPVDATLKATSTALTEMSKLNLGDARLMSAVEEGAEAMASHQEVSTGVPPLELDEIAFYAGLSVDFCLTCRINK